MTEEELKAGGWRLLPTVRYSAALGPVWARFGENGPEIALDAQEHLGNDSFGIVHGGAVMTFADMACGFAVGHAVRGASSFGDAAGSAFVTAQLQVHFTAAGKVGTFIYAYPEVVRKTSQLVFVRTLIECEGRTIASADGIFKLLDPEKIAKIKAN